MTVYVDDVNISAQLPGMRPAIWCHMTADTKAELHAFAISLGLRRAWFQDPVAQGKCKTGCPMAGHWHYDVTKSVRAKAVKAGAVEIGHGLEWFEKVWHHPDREGVKMAELNYVEPPVGNKKELGLKIAQRFCMQTTDGHSKTFGRDLASTDIMVCSKCRLPRWDYYLAHRSSQPPGVPIKYAKGLDND